MKTKTRSRNKEMQVKPVEKYSDKLVQDIKEAKEDYKNGKYFKGTAAEVIKNLRDEVNKIKKV